jgi:probable F420-dependent oxidoreductase
VKFLTPIPAAFMYPPVAAPWEIDATPDHAMRAIDKGDELGFDYMNTPDHIIMPNEHLHLMGPRWSEALTVMAMIAARTKRMKAYGTILIVPYRHPLQTAKALATIDWMSNGRVALGAAVGHEEREFQILGASFKDRGEVTDEYLLAMKELWTQEKPEFHGKYVDFSDIAFEPKPVPKPHIPILIGGNTRVAQRRAARLGDGWHPWLVTRKELPGCLEYIKEQPGFGDNARPFEVFMPLVPINVDENHEPLGETPIPFTKDQLIEEVAELESVGATGTVVSIPRVDTFEEYLEKMEFFAQEVMPRFKKDTPQPATA